MVVRRFAPFIVLAVAAVCGAIPPAGNQVNYVIHVSVDGGGSSYIQNLVNLGQLPNFQRLQTEGAWTHNARCDYNVSITLPNHVTQVTGRGVIGVAGNGHGWTSNSDPLAGQTIHSNKGSYVASAFDVAHDNGLRTGVYATKTKFSLFDTSYNATNGADDPTPPDNGRDKVDTYLYNSNSSVLTSSFVSAMTANPFNYALVHFTDADSAGHGSSWGSTTYNNSLKTVDGYIASLFNLVTTNPALHDRTAIIVTADHGGHFADHSNASDPLNYTIPFYVWGPGVTAGADLYGLNTLTRLDPGAGRPTYLDVLQPIRNGDAANLALDLMRRGPIPGSTINLAQDLAVPEPTSLGLLMVAAVGLIRRTWRKDR